MSWKSAVRDLVEQAANWAPPKLERHWHGFGNDPDVQALELWFNGKRLYLEPAEWAVNTLPTSVDFWSSRGPRVRLVGPDEEGKWKVLTSDLVDMHRSWDKPSFESLCEDLLAV